MSRSTALPPLEAWQVETMRLTAFPAEPLGTDIQWWEELVGTPADSVVTRPKSGYAQIDGNFEGRQLTLRTQTDRVDWRLAPVIASNEVPPELPLAGPYPEVLGSFLKIAERWLAIAPPLSRLAFAPVLMQSVEDRRSGYIQIARYLPNVRIDPESSDFLYQINRPRLSGSGIPGLSINRLMKWSVALYQVMSMGVPQPGRMAIRTTLRDAACRLELDINTAPAFGAVLSAEHYWPLFRELVDIATEIAERGDIP